MIKKKKCKCKKFATRCSDGAKFCEDCGKEKK